MNFRHKYWITVLEFPCLIAAGIILYTEIGYRGLFGLLLAFIGFELHLIYHRIEREENIRNKAVRQIKPD